jgi:hypothetical protein
MLQCLPCHMLQLFHLTYVLCLLPLLWLLHAPVLLPLLLLLLWVLLHAHVMLLLIIMVWIMTRVG